jgi:hypothetical protein
MSSHQPNSVQIGLQSHHRGHRSSSSIPMNGYSSQSFNSHGGKTASQAGMHDFSPYKQESQAYIPMGEYLSSSAITGLGSHGGAGAALSASYGGGTRGGMNGDSSMNGHSAHSKRHRASDGLSVGGMPSSLHEDALMELARENLLLKRQLQVASLEVQLSSLSHP